jgi:hypothetical protein
MMLTEYLMVELCLPQSKDRLSCHFNFGRLRLAFSSQPDKIPPEDILMPQNESADLHIEVGDTLTSADSKVHILGYDLDADAYLCDIFSLDGKLIGHSMLIRATIIETCFRKRG